MFKRLGAFLRVYPKLLIDPKASSRAKYLPLVALLYLFSPIDLVPDFIPLLGQLDDVGAITILLNIALWAFEQSPEQSKKKQYGEVIDVEAVKNK